MIGYDAVGVLQSVLNTQIGSNLRDSINMLTKAMILHPIAAGLAFFAFLISAASGSLGSFIGGLIAFITWLIALVVMAIDLAMFGVRALLFLQYAISTTDIFTCPANKEQCQFQRRWGLCRLFGRYVDLRCRGGVVVRWELGCVVYLLLRSACQA